jgi:hypothetical protein
MDDRVVSFSIKPTDKTGLEDLRKLKQHSKETGISFSYLIISAISRKNEELKLK